MSNSRPLSVKDRVELLSRWFKEWNHCEQTLALYSLLRRVSPTQARFLSFVLNQKLRNESQDIEQIDIEANSSSYLKSLYAETEEDALEQLLAHLPLLRPGNSEGKEEYLTLLPKVLLGSCEEQNYMDQCKQLLSLSLVHPAFNQDDRAKLSYWLTRLHDKPDRRPNTVTSHSPTPDKRPCPLPPLPSRDGSSLGSSSAYEDYCENGETDEDDLEYMTVQQFLPPEKGGISNTFPQTQNHPSPPIPPKSSISLPRPSPSPSPAMSMLNSRDELSMPNFQPGMKDIPIWLKSLRLHKYQYVFENLSYDEMMDISDDSLAAQSVTQGARNKILQNIKKLTLRTQSLLDLEKEVGKPGRQTLASIIRELRQMLITPIKPAQEDAWGSTISSQSSNDTSAPSEVDHSDDSTSSSDSSSPISSPKTPPSSEYSLSMSSSDHSSSDSISRDEELPALITRVMTKVFNQMMMPGGADEECYRLFLQLLDDTANHECFTMEQQKLFSSWKQVCHQNFRVFSPRKKPSGSTSGSSSSKKWNGVGSAHSFPGQGSSRPPKLPARSATRPKGMVTPTPPPTPGASQCSSARSTPVPSSVNRLTPRHMVQQYPPMSRANSIPYLNHLDPHHLDQLTGGHNYQPRRDHQDHHYMDSMDDLSKRMTEQALSDDQDTLPDPSY